MNILQIFDQTAPLVSGYSMRSRYISESLVKLGVKVKALSSPIFSYSKEQEEINGVNYIRSSISNWHILKKLPILKENRIVSCLKSNIGNVINGQPIILDAHSSVLNGLAASKVAQKYNLPFIYEIRALWEDAAVDQGKTKEGSFRYNFTRKLETDVIKKADHVTVICEGLKNDIMGRGISEDKITVIPNGVDIDKFKKQASDKDLCDKYDLKDKLVFGFVGTFFEFEGLLMLCEAAKELIAKNKNIKFMLVGAGRDEQRVKDYVKEHGLEESIILTGRVKHDEVQKYYSVIDVCVYPRISKRITELVTPLKPLEAMALEKIVIASSVGGCRELVTDGENGLIFKSDDVRDLIAKCQYVIDHQSDMGKMAKDARLYVEKERNWMTICNNYLPIFKKLGVDQ